MLQISAELLAMSAEPAVLIKNNKIVFANAGAIEILGRDCHGKSTAQVFGPDIAGMQSGAFIGEFSVGDKRFILRVRTAEGIKAVFMSQTAPEPNLISDAFLFSLRNSLMNVNLSMSLLRDKAYLSPDLRRSLAVISQDFYKINRTISNTSIIRSLSQNNYIFNPVQLDLKLFISDITDTLKTLFEGLDIRFSATGPTEIYADPTLLECLSLNLLSNCLLHAKGMSHISVCLIGGKDRVFLCIDDDGCGIKQDELHHVFDRYRASMDLGSMGKGPGFGLTVSRLIAAQHGGTLLLESREDSGTAVRVSLSANPYRHTNLSNPAPEYTRDIGSFLSGLSGCLPLECFMGQYFD